jgi:lysophospholipase L1-like esterase
MRGTLIRAFVNGYEFKRVINNERSTGRIGFCFQGATSSVTGMHLDSLEARDESATSQVLFHGDSLTSGQGTSGTLAHADKYPTQTMALLDSSFDWANLGVSGRTLVDLIANAAEIDDCRRTEAESDIVVLWAGVNDLAVLGASPSTVVDRLTEYAAGRRALGFQVLVLTIIAADESHPAIPTGFNSQRETVNAWLRANWSAHFDGLADVAADPRLSNPADPAYYEADGIHLEAAGAAAAAEIVADALSAMKEASLQVTSPTEAEIVLVGAANEIAWQTTGDVPTVRIEFSDDGGATYAVLEEELLNSGSYNWTPADSQLTATARVRVASSDGSVEAESPVFNVATTSASGDGVTTEQLASALQELQEHGDNNWGRNPILPVIARVNQEPVAKTTLVAYQRGRSQHQLVVVDSTGAGVDLSGKSLQFTLETLSGARVGSTSDVSVLGPDGNVASFTAVEEWHAQPGLFRYALRDLGDGARVWARGDYLIEPTAGPVV